MKASSFLMVTAVLLLMSDFTFGKKVLPIRNGKIVYFNLNKDSTIDLFFNEEIYYEKKIDCLENKMVIRKGINSRWFLFYSFCNCVEPPKGVHWILDFKKIKYFSKGNKKYFKIVGARKSLGEFEILLNEISSAKLRIIYNDIFKLNKCM